VLASLVEVAAGAVVVDIMDMVDIIAADMVGTIKHLNMIKISHQFNKLFHGGWNENIVRYDDRYDRNKFDRMFSHRQQFFFSTTRTFRREI
jgi:hypothetical protein